MLDYSYVSGLVLASVAISLMAAFTGLWLTRGLSAMSAPIRQVRISMGSVALGIGVWSMHFIAMLAVRLPIPVSYQVLPTLASLLIAILLSGIALLTMHHSRRRPAHVAAAGAALGLGIALMHYMGMSAMEFCRPVYAPVSVGLALVAALGMGIAAIRTAYGERDRRHLLLGTVVLGLSVVIVHFTGMAGTGFLALETTADAPAMDQQQLALVVLFLAFVICGAFLLCGATFLDGRPAVPAPVPGPPPAAMRETARIPVERRGHTEFIPPAEIAALRAEGHYTMAYTGDGLHLCPWSISEAEKRLSESAFFRAHRSYLVNVSRISAFEKQGDGGVCLFEGIEPPGRVPVSRSKVPALRQALGL